MVSIMETKGLRVPAALQAIDEKVSNGVIGAMRMVAGLLWLANIEWKRPPDFGRTQRNGLFKYVQSAIDHPVFSPYSWVVENVITKQYSFFGWVTLLVESVLAALLLIGLATRIAALVGAGMSVTILLSVLHYRNSDGKEIEWSWSYFLMIALHLTLFAVAAGRFAGVDGVRKGRISRERVALWLGVVAVVVGIGGFLASKHLDFADKTGAIFGFQNGWELKLLWFNGLSALATVIGGVVLIGAWALRSNPAVSRPMLFAASAFFAVLAILVLFLWRNRTGGFLGATGPTFAFWLMFPLAILTTLPRSGSLDSPTTARSQPEP